MSDIVWGSIGILFIIFLFAGDPNVWDSVHAAVVNWGGVK